MTEDKPSSASSSSLISARSSSSSSSSKRGGYGNKSGGTKRKTSPSSPKFKQVARAPSITKQLAISTTNESNTQKQEDELASPPTALDVIDTEAEMFFSIETRLEMKERLTKCQERLFPLLLEIKIAWMKCFSTSTLEESMVVVDIERIQKSKEIVHQGEELTELFLQALESIETSTTRIEMLKENVEKVETHLDTFHTLIKSTAILSPPPSSVSPTLSPPKLPPTSGHSTLSNVQVFARDSQFVTYDLPSMKTYCQKVAPPASSYVKNKITKKK